MRRLVVGSGYLGERVARLWRDKGDEVFATTRGSRVDALSRAGLQPLTLDVMRGPLRELPVVDTILFAVGRVRGSGVSAFDIHVQGLGAVLDARPASPGRVLYVSSTGVYGQDAGEWVDEESVCEPTREGGRASLAAEQLLRTHAQGHNATILRLAGLYGGSRVPWQSHVIGGRTIAGSPDAYVNLIHADDAARAVVAAAASAAAGGRVYTVSDGNPPTRGAYVQWLAQRFGVAAPPFEGGSGLGKRVRNERLVGELGVRLTYPSFREGLGSNPAGSTDR